jgi:anti-sigma factor RsiW
MDHQKIQALLLTTDSPELSPEERREVAAHLQACRDCGGLAARWERIHGMFAHVSAVPPPPGMADKIMKRLADLEASDVEPQAVRRPWVQWLFPTLGYAFAFLLMFVAIAHWEPYLKANPTTETVLLSSIPQGDQLFFAKDPPEVNHLYVTQ